MFDQNTAMNNGSGNVMRSEEMITIEIGLNKKNLLTCNCNFKGYFGFKATLDVILLDTGVSLVVAKRKIWVMEDLQSAICNQIVIKYAGCDVY